MARTLATLALLLLAGCLEERSTCVLRADGKGTFVQRTVLHLEGARTYADLLAARARDAGGSAQEPEPDPFARIGAARRADTVAGAPGVRVSKSTQADDAEARTRTYELELAFDSLADLYRSGVFEDVRVTLERVKDRAAWRLTVRHAAVPGDREPLEGDAAERLRALRARLLEAYAPQWGSLVVESTLRLPTPILETNGQRTPEGHGVTWRIAFKDLADPRKLVQQVTFEADEALTLTPFELSAREIERAVARRRVDGAKEEDAKSGKGRDAENGKGGDR